MEVFLSSGCTRGPGWTGRGADVLGLPLTQGMSEDTTAPGGSIADDKVTRLKVNLCYLHLITTSRVLVPAEQSLSPHRFSACPAEKKASSRITLSFLRL